MVRSRQSGSCVATRLQTLITELAESVGAETYSSHRRRMKERTSSAAADVAASSPGLVVFADAQVNDRYDVMSEPLVQLRIGEIIARQAGQR